MASEPPVCGRVAPVPPEARAPAVSITVPTSRLAVHALAGGTGVGEPVVFVHGNVSSSQFFAETLAALPGRYRMLAVDLRGFGATECAPVDATRGLRDFSDDLYALLDALGERRRAHLVGWSLGGGVVMQYALDRPEVVASLTLVAPVSPYGLGGTRDAHGTRCWPDWAGSGAGTVNPEFPRRLLRAETAAGDHSAPRNVMNVLYFRPPFRTAPEMEEALVAAMFQTAVGEENYPGDFAKSANWPHTAPGERGVINAISPKYCDLGGFARLAPGPPVLWVRGAEDRIVAEESVLDPGYLGSIGALAGWPGETAYPAQPMISQTRAVLEEYRRGGGEYREVVVPACGHSPHIEQPEIFLNTLNEFLEEST